MKKRLFTFFIAFILFSNNIFSETNSSYDDVDFPQWSKDLRRTEIITLGSLPFVTLWTTVGYSVAVFGEFRNPLDKSSDGFESEDQKKVVMISAGTCLALGLTDLLITIIQRNRKKNLAMKKNQNPKVEPSINSEDLPTKESRAHLIKGVVDNAIF